MSSCVQYGIDKNGKATVSVRSGYVGEFKYFGFEEVPAHCLACDGSEISRAAYSELFAVFGTTWGEGDGETTFNLPDFTTDGAFLRSTGGLAEAIGTKQGDAIRDAQGHIEAVAVWSTPSGGSVTGTVAQGIWKVLCSKDGITTDNVFVQGATSGSNYLAVGVAARTTTTYTDYGTNFMLSNAVPTADENRPINYAVNICVVYE